MKMCKCGCGEPAPIVKRGGFKFRSGDYADYVNTAHKARHKRQLKKAGMAEKEPEFCSVYFINHHNGWIL